MENVQLIYTLVHPSTLEEKWPALGPWVVQAIGDEVNYMDVEYVKAQVLCGNCCIWVGHASEHYEANAIEVVLVCEIAFYCGMRTLVLRWLSGRNMPSWLAHLPHLENWASCQGFVRMEIWGRKGWERELKPHGYKHDTTRLSKFLARSIH